jgi:hypothetical protein
VQKATFVPVALNPENEKRTTTNEGLAINPRPAAHQGALLEQA